MIAPRRMDRPEPGYFLMTLVKNGPRIPAAIIWVESVAEPGVPGNDMRGTRSRHLAAFIAGDPVPVDSVWLRRGIPITKEEHDFRCADIAWAKQHAPEEAIAQPRKRIDLATAPPVYQRKG